MNKLISFTFILYLSSCGEKDCIKPSDIVEGKGIEGKWQWESSESGFGKMTPESEGYTRTLLIDDFYFNDFINDTIAKQLQYDAEIRTDTFLGIHQYLKLSNGEEYAFTFIGNDTLWLIELCIDCYDHQFIRM